MYGEAQPPLAATGVAGLTVAGTYISLGQMLAIAVAVIIVGAVLYRYAGRRRRDQAPTAG